MFRTFLQLVLFLVTLSSQAQNLVIKNVNVIPMDKDTVLNRQDVFIEGDRIDRIATSGSETYRGYEEVEATGKFLIPGLSDMHMHFLADDRIADEYRKHELLVPLTYGVLSGRVPIGNSGLLRDKQLIDQGDLLGPYLQIGSPQLAGVNFSPVFNGSLVKTEQEAYQAVKRYKNEGYAFIKITFGVNQAVYESIIRAGRDFDIPIAGHVPVAVGIRKALQANQDIEHLDQYMDGILADDPPTKTGLSAFGLFRSKSWQTVDHIDTAKIQELIDLTVESGVWNTPTNHFFVSSFARKVPDEELVNDPAYTLVSEEVRNELLSMRQRYWSRAVNQEKREKYVNLRSLFIREIFRSNKHILAGSDSPEWLNLYGGALHKELFNFVEIVGLTPYEALFTATMAPAQYLNQLNRGAIKTGARADLVLLDQNPLENVRNLGGIAGVILKGRWMDQTALNDLYEQAKEKLAKAPLRPEYRE